MKKLLALIIIFIFALLFLRGWWNFQLSPVGKEQIEVNFIIPKEQGLNEIAKRLKEEGFIKSEFAFKILVRQKGLEKKIQSGTFKLSPSMEAGEIGQKLAGGASEKWVTLIEGWRKEEMAQELSSKFQVPSSKFLALAREGYMFPDTYLFPNDISEEQIVSTLRDNFENKFSEDLRGKVKRLGLSENDAVILASIIEREARSQEARRMVASILLKRLKIGMGLNADATIQYALGYQQDEKSWWKRHLSKEDLKVKSDYNTYLHAGLPPTPICNPGLVSLQAVANADSSTPYLYYYHDSKGRSHYGRTLEEHNTNVANNP